MSFGCASKGAIFLDRDGTLNRLNPGGYVTHRDDFFWLPGALDALAFLSKNSERRIVVCTNQSCIGKDLATAQQVGELHLWMKQRIEQAGGRVDGLYVCPHAPEDACHCRKPAPGLLWQAAEELGLDLDKSAMIGDSSTDVRAAQYAVIPEIYYVMTGWGQSDLPRDLSVRIMADLEAAVKMVVMREKEQ